MFPSAAQGSQDQASTQGPERQRSKDPLEEAFRLLGKLEPEVQALDVALTAASIAISMRRIANSLELLAGSTSSMSYDNARLREAISNSDAALGKIGNSVERLVNEAAAKRIR